MPTQYLIRREALQVAPYDAAQMGQGPGEVLARFLFPLLIELDSLLDKRLVRTFLATIQVIITFRDRANGLLLSELGSYLATPGQAHAGTKRLSNLLHSCKWAAWLIARFLWQRASQQVEEWTQTGQEGLVIWDESVWDALTGKLLLTYRGHAAEVLAVAWSPDGKYFASGSNDGIVQVWVSA